MKKILFVLLCLIGFSSFCSAGNYEYTGHVQMTTFLSNNQVLFGTPILASSSNSTSSFTVQCDLTNYSSDNDFFIRFWYVKGIKGTFYGNNVNASATYISNKSISYTFTNDGITTVLAVVDTAPNSVVSISFDWSCVVSGVDILSLGGSCPTCPTCPSQYTSEECQIEYDLVPSSDLSTCNDNLQSCQASLSGRNNTLNNCSNNLLSCESSLSSCIQSNCPIDTGSVMWSSIWINGIQHLGKPVINIDIPDQIYWDYSTNDEEFDLYVGSGYDQNYIDSVIAINSYQPSSEDFTKIFVGGLTLIFPYIFIALLILFIWKLVKRIFK